MILDVSNDNCQTANFGIATTATSTTRQWDIRVTQYTCGEEDNAGPPGCLQYLTGTYGSIADYAFTPTITKSSEITASAVSHLKNQYYEICFRREAGYCYICYNPIRTPTTANADQISYGLGLSPAAAIGQSQIGSSCTTDYITVIYILL